jgi:dephospho-CoA kinase
VSLRIGLTGGIGSGKSTVAAMLAELGAHVVDTDAISRRLTAAGGAALPAIEHAFGPEMVGPDGALNRVRMRELVFMDPAAKTRLEAILHPLIGQHTDREAATALPDQAVVFDVPLLAESPRWRGRVDKVLVVDCDEQTQIDRVMQRSGWGEAEVRRVLAQQATRAQRRAIADAVILNDQLDLDGLRAAVRTVWQQWCPGTPASSV